MKVNELLISYEIFRSNAEQDLLSKLGVGVPLESLTENEEVIFISLERKNLVNRVEKNGQVLVKRNEYCYTPFTRTFE